MYQMHLSLCSPLAGTNSHTDGIHLSMRTMMVSNEMQPKSQDRVIMIMHRYKLDLEKKVT